MPEVIKHLEAFAPLKFAESWDNVGLMVEPSTPLDVNKILLTNDLTENVMDEAIKSNANLIISYHPPIFTGMKRLTNAQWKDRIIIKCLENRIAIYSPHTSWDACPNGVNDWLANSLPNSRKIPATPNEVDSDFGGGRVCDVDQPFTLKDAIEKIKKYTGLPNVHVATAVNATLDSQVKKFGVCAGSGASILKSIRDPIDLFLTGETSHHEALDATHKQISVIALNHSNSERGYLKEFKNIIGKNLSGVEIMVSESDRDPLSTY